MALIPIRVDRTSKPPLGTPLRSDGHWSVQGLVGEFYLGNGTAVDVVNSKLGVVVGAKNVPEGYRFSKNTHAIAFADNDRYNVSVNMSVFISFYVDSVPTDQMIILERNEYGLRVTLSGWEYSPGNQHIICSFGTSIDVVIPGENKYKWVGIAYTCSAEGQKIYADGMLLGSDANSNGSFISANDVIFGKNIDNYYPFKGTIRKASLYNIALAPQQIASLSANPWQIYEPETVWVEVGGGGEQSLFAGTIYGQSSASAQLSTSITIASQVVAAGNIAGGLTTAIRMATNTQGSASASALLTSAIRMAASAQGYGSATADLSTVIALAADILAASSASGALSTVIRLGGALSGASTTTAALTNAITLAAQAVGLGSISGQLAGTVAAALFAGTVSGSSSASANLSTAVVLAAAAQGSATAQAALSTALVLAAQVNGIGAATGALGVDISGLAGSLHGSSEAQATLSTAIHLMGVAAGQCGVVGRLAEPVEILAQLRVMASDPLALSISVRDPLALRVTVH